MYPASEKRFLILNLITIISLFVLILAGGIVRGTGSGMGCPDWPKCFGQYIPPTDIAQLPKGYEEKYVAERIKKNERFSKTLDVLGFGEMANAIRDDKSISKPEPFNVFKTWTEYINRLIGAITGFFLLGCTALSVIYLRKRKRIFFMSLLNLILVGFQAWLGSIVVSTNLLSWVVTIHMLLALAIIAISIYTYFQAQMLRTRNLIPNQDASFIKYLATSILLVTVVQVGLGTEVREQIDAVATEMNNLNRSDWVSKIGQQFNWHRDLAILVTLLNVILYMVIRIRYPLMGFQYVHSKYNLIIIGGQIITGIILAYLALPPFSQVAHLFLATLLFGNQFYLLLLVTNKRTRLRRSI